MSAAPRAPIVVFAIGNPSRGDDALGPVIYGRLEEWLKTAGLLDQVELIEDFQLQIEHALDLVDRDLALFIDAGIETPAPFVFRHIQASTAVAHTTHALAPEAVLQVCQQTGYAPPPSFVLCVRGESFELGAPLSEAACSHADAALIRLHDLLQQPIPEFWLTGAA